MQERLRSSKICLHQEPEVEKEWLGHVFWSSFGPEAPLSASIGGAFLKGKGSACARRGQVVLSALSRAYSGTAFGDDTADWEGVLAVDTANGFSNSSLYGSWEHVPSKKGQ